MTRDTTVGDALSASLPALREAGMQRFFFLLGILFLLAALLWPWLSRFPFGRLPGDIVIERENFTFYFPFTTSILVSVLLSLLFWLWRK